jgi:hypothetical protein
MFALTYLCFWISSTRVIGRVRKKTLFAGCSKTLRYKATEIPRSESRRVLRDAMTRDEGNAVDGRFSTTCCPSHAPFLKEVPE